MFTTLFTVAKKWKQPKCPSAGEWILTQAAAWMNLEDIVLSEMSPSHEGPRLVKSIDTALVGARGWGREE